MHRNENNIIKRILKSGTKHKRDAYIWNTATGIISALQTTLILMVMTRTNSVADAGVFAIAYAIANMMYFIGLFGIRNFQVSDIREEYTFNTYYGARVITCSIMLLASLGYCIYGINIKEYDTVKSIVIFLICCSKCIDAMCDLLNGRMQQCGRLDVAAKATLSRTALSTIFCMIALILTNNLLYSVIIFVASSLIVFLLTSVNVVTDFCRFIPSFNFKKIFKLLAMVTPVFLSTFLDVYATNAPKYAIDSVLSDELQAIYGFVFMPSLAIGILAHLVYDPAIRDYTKIWIFGNTTAICKLIIKQVFIVIILTIFAVIFGYFFGIPILSIIFDVNLSEYKVVLCIALIGGGVTALNTFYSILLIIMRRQILSMFIYAITAFGALVISSDFVLTNGLFGASIEYLLLMTITNVLFIVAIILYLYIFKKRMTKSLLI